MLGQTNDSVEGSLMIPAQSADFGEDGASGVRVTLAMVEELAIGHELLGVSFNVVRKDSGMVVGATPCGPFEPDTAVLALGGRSQRMELLLKVGSHL